MAHLAHLPDRAVLAVEGPDRVAFLQGLVSNDVTEVSPGRAVWAALLSPQGKWLADFFILSDGARLFLDCEAGQTMFLATRLTRFRLRAQVTVLPSPLGVFAAWDGTPLLPNGVVGAPDPRLPDAGWRVLAQTLPTTADADAWDLHRLGLGLPDGSRDLQADKTVLMEAGFDELHGVSWTKGCYMGQELTARTRYRGLVKRRLLPVGISGPAVDPGTAILLNGTEVGEIRSSRNGIGLALLRLQAIRAEALTCGGATLRPLIPTWMKLPEPAESG